MPDNLGRGSQVTELLRRWGRGDRAALDGLMPLVYQELHRLASRYMTAERAGHTLQPTALVHEAYVRLVDQRSADWQNRAQFFGLAAQAMRRILVDHARSRARAKRGSDPARAPVETLDVLAAPTTGLEDAVAIDDALKRLEAQDPEQARIVELRFFGGLTVEETAAVMSMSPRTVKREWALARAWLRRELASGSPGGDQDDQTVR
jgi:RNA polymerase sigma factor (TIGR02999 family)